MRSISFALTLVLSTPWLARVQATEGAGKPGFRTAVLVKNGIQTTCEVALLNNKFGFIAANCLDYEGQSQVSKTSVYEVYMNAYKDSPPVKYKVAKYHIPDLFNANSLANNVAVVRFNDDAAIEWTNPIAVNRAEWQGMTYMRSAMTDVANMKWANAQTYAANDMSLDSLCSDYSGIYSANENAFWCGNPTTTSVYNKKCMISYSTVYAKLNSTTYALAGLYSHTVVAGRNLCQNKPQITYFTLLENYLTYAGSVTGTRPDYISGNLSYVPKDNVDYKMKKASSNNPSDVSQFSGNLYTYEGVDQKPAPIDSSSTAVDSSSATSSPSPSSTNSNRGQNVDNSGLSRTQTIIIAVVVPVVSIAIVVALFFLYKWYRKRKHDKEWDPRAERSNYNAQNIARDFDQGSRSPSPLLSAPPPAPAPAPANATPLTINPIPNASDIRNNPNLYRITGLFGPNTPRLSQPPPPYVEPHFRNSVFSQPMSPRPNDHAIPPVPPLPPMSPGAVVSPRTATFNALDRKMP